MRTTVVYNLHRVESHNTMDPQPRGSIHEHGYFGIPHTHPRLLEEDNTFAPPALSAYGIALLGESIHPEVSPKGSLKNKLSVHFPASESLPLNSSPASKNQTLPPESSSSNAANTTNVTSVSMSDLSGHSHPHIGSSNASNISNMYSHSDKAAVSSNAHSNVAFINPTPSPNKPNTIANSHSSQAGSPRNGDFLASSENPDTKESSLKLDPHKPQPASTGSLPVRQVKRSRLSRRFKSLGPPKRASDVDFEQSAVSSTNEVFNHSESVQSRRPSHENSDASPGSQIALARIEDYKFSRPSNGIINPRAVSDSIIQASPAKKAISGNSEFFKSLERLKSGTNLAASNPVSRDVGHSSRLPSDSAPSHRVPLHEYSPQYLNAEPPAEFRKPKNPKSPISNPEPKPHSATSTVTPLPSAALVTRKRAYEPQTLNENPSRRKSIFVNSNQYEKLELLGRGGSSKVYKVRSLADKKIYAIKKVSFDQFDETCIKGFKGEIDLLKRLKHDSRVVSLLDHAVSEGSIYLVMECGDLDLAHVLSHKLATGKSLDINFVRFHATEILRCVQAVHRAGIVHSDLKPANFLFVRGTLKIIDFGIANAVPDHTANIYRQSQIGTPNYMAPEALIEASGGAGVNKVSTWKVGQPSDIWSCGCIIYQMIYGRPPYGAFSGQQRIMAIMNPMVEIQFSSKGIDGNKVPQSSVILMRKCLERNPNNRWTVEQCLESDFLKPKAVNKAFLKDLVYSAVNFGYNSKDSGNLTDELYDKLVDTVLKQIEELNFA